MWPIESVTLVEVWRWEALAAVVPVRPHHQVSLAWSARCPVVAQPQLPQSGLSPEGRCQEWEHLEVDGGPLNLYPHPLPLVLPPGRGVREAAQPQLQFAPFEPEAGLEWEERIGKMMDALTSPLPCTCT